MDFTESLESQNLDMIGEIFKRYVQADAKDWENETRREEFDEGVNMTELEDKLALIDWNENKTFLLLASQHSTDALLRVRWKSVLQHEFFGSFKSVTDYGACNVIYPNIDFSSERWNLTDRQYDGMTLHNVTYGVRNGIDSGLAILADTEAFDYAFYLRLAKGFMIAMADNRY